MKFETTRFGEVDVLPEDIYVFPEGLLGFPDCTRYTFIDSDGTEPFRMMQSLDNSNLAFVIIEPAMVFPKYAFDITKEDLKYLKASAIEGLIVYAIVTMASDLKDVTVNLQGPLVVNNETRLGHQFVLVHTDYTTREKLLQTEEGVEESKEAVIQKQAVKEAV